MEIRRKRNAEENLLNKRIGASNSLTFTLLTLPAILVAPNCTSISGNSQKTCSNGSKRALILYLYPIIKKLILIP